jgi:triacylglycerol esterase/lipase EstA (alpha/beta hydrolase family)
VDRLKHPVLLVPGWRDRARKLRHLQQHLLAAGWPAHTVHSLEFRNRFGGNVEHADELAAAMRALAGNESGERIDIVAHSMGGLAVRQLLHKHAERAHVRRVVFLGTPHAGTLAAYLDWGQGARDMRRGSAFLNALAAAAPVEPIELISIRTPLDMRVFPGASAELSGARNLTIWCAGHRRLLRAPVVLRLVQSVLESD